MMAKKFRMILTFLLCSVLMFTGCSSDVAVNSSEKDSSSEDGSSMKDESGSVSSETSLSDDAVINKAQRITSNLVEIYFSDNYDGPKPPDISGFVLEKSDGTKLELDKDYGYGKTVFFDNILTLKLKNDLSEDENANEIILKYDEQEYRVPYDEYYKYELKTECGMTVKGSRALTKGQETLEKAGKMVDIMLKIRPDIVAKMNEAGGYFAVYGKGEHAYMVPEYRDDYDEKMLYVEGFGGLPCTVAEANVWNWTKETTPDPEYTSNYYNESILTHEYAHGIKLLGMDLLDDQSLAQEYQMVYRHAKAAGLWPNSYEISNSDEYFAVLSTIWFNVMSESNGDDVWDGTRGPVNTRKELYNYDRDAYNFFAKIYPFESMPDEWSTHVDKYTITGLGTEEPKDLTGQNIVFKYPEQDNSTGINFSDTFKIVNAMNGKVIDANATETGAGLWWDYAKEYPDTIPPMSYKFEAVPNSEAVTENGKTTVKVYIKNEANGYVYSLDGKLVTAGNVEKVPETPTEFTIVTDENNVSTISCADGFLKSDGDADGTPVTVSPEGSNWRVEKLGTQGTLVVFVHDCKADGNENGVMAAAGQEVQIAADPAPEGKHFAGWKVSGGTVEDSASETTKLTMSDKDAVIWATYAE